MKQQQESEVLVSRAFEMNQIMGHGFRFQTLTNFSVRQFRQKREPEESMGGAPHQQDKSGKLE